MDITEKRINPTNDLLFKKMLASPEHTDILGGFIRDFFNIEPEELTLETPYSIRAYTEERGGRDASVLRETRADIRALVRAGTVMAEMQVNNTQFFDRRAFYYSCEAYCSNYNRPLPPEAAGQSEDGQVKSRYSTLRPVYAMNILDYTHFENDAKALRIFAMRDKETGEPMPGELLTIGFFELQKPDLPTRNQRHWQTLFVTGGAPADAPDYIRKAAELVSYVNLDKEEREMYDRVTMAEADRDAQIAWGIEKGYAAAYAAGYAAGYATGYAAGRLEVAVLMAQVLKADGYSEEKIKAWLSVLGEDVVRAVWSALPPDDANRSILESLEDKKNQVGAQSKKPLADRPDR